MAKDYWRFVDEVIDFILDGTADRIEKDGIAVFRDNEGIKIDCGEHAAQMSERFASKSSADDTESPSNLYEVVLPETHKSKKKLYICTQISRVLERNGIEIEGVYTYRGARITKFQIVLGDNGTVSDVEAIADEFLKETGATSVEIEIPDSNDYDCAVVLPNY